MTDTNTGPSASFDGADGPLGLDDLFSAELTASCSPRNRSAVALLP